MAKANSRLTHAQRCQIEAYLSTGASHTAIARVIGVHQSTISREIKRNAGSNDAYRAECAQCKRDERVRAAAEQPRKVKPEHYVYIDERLAAGDSPDVIAQGLSAPHLRLSTPWVYALIDRQVQAGDDDLKGYLLRKYKKRRPKRKISAGAGLIPNRVDIAQRPAVVNDRLAFGHWEGDTIVGAGHQGSVVTLLERKTRQLVCFPLNHRTKDAVADGIIAWLYDAKDTVLTLTFDNGGEFAAHERIARELGCDIYFAKPYHSWQRGASENVNGLLRRFLPKGESLLDVDPTRVATAAATINAMRRRVLSFDSAQMRFEAERQALTAAQP